MNNKQTVVLATITIMCISLLVCFGCTNIDNIVTDDGQITDDSQADTEDDTPIVVNADLASGNTEFGFNLFQEIYKTDNDMNIFISPYSVSVALAMTLNGAAADTEQEMADTLQLQGLSSETINGSFSQLQEALQTSDPKVTLSIANSLWANEGYTFKSDFLQRNENHFNAEVSILDFLDASTLTTINQWVNDNTNSKIPTILDSIDRSAVLYLINAIYFKGTWQTEFKPENTRDGTFNLADGSQKRVPMMFRSGGSYSHYQSDTVQAISLPYGDGQFSMYIFVPTNKSDLNAFLDTLTPENWENWMTEFSKREMDLRMPKFKVEYGAKELKDVLTTLGMGVAFDSGRADFSRMADLDDLGSNLYIDTVLHKTFVEVNEEGTEAAAATVVGIVKTSLPPQFNVDRPFFYAIRDNETGTVLFMGTVIDPS